MTRKGLVFLLAGLIGSVTARGGLKSVDPVAGTVPGMAPLGSRAGKLGAEAPAYARLENIAALDGRVAPCPGIRRRAPGIDADVAAVAGISAAADAIGLDAPGYAPLSGTTGLLADPFLAPLDIWRDGPLGRLRAEALRARQRGETGRFEALRTRFWERYRIAERRRAVLGDGRRGR